MDVNDALVIDVMIEDIGSLINEYHESDEVNIPLKIPKKDSDENSYT